MVEQVSREDRAAVVFAQTQALGKALQERPAALDEWLVSHALAPDDALATWWRVFECERRRREDRGVA